jgi:hypothetical protein
VVIYGVFKERTMEWLKDKWTHIKADIRKSYKSVTIWFNGVLTFAVAAFLEFQDSIPALKEYVGESTFKYLMLATLIVNFILRFKTKSALRDK